MKRFDATAFLAEIDGATEIRKGAFRSERSLDAFADEIHRLAFEVHKLAAIKAIWQAAQRRNDR